MELVLAKDLDWSRKRPCADCPFLKTSPFHQGVAGSLPEYVRSIEDGRFAHTCHKTDNRAEVDGPKNFRGERAQHCAGAVLMLLKTGKTMDLQLPLLEAAERGDLDLAEMTAIAKASDDVFTVGELLQFYADGLEEMLDTPRGRAEERRRKKRSRLRGGTS